MHIMFVPFVPIPMEKAIKVAKKFQGIGNTIAKTKPSLKLNLYQAGIDIQPREYCSVTVFSSIFFFVILTSVIFLASFMSGAIDFVLPLAVGGVFSLFVYVYLLNWPKLTANRRMRKLERDLLNALQHLLIEVKSGVTLFDSMVGISEGYGEVSGEFRKIVKEINSGIPQTKALDSASKRNPSLYFRRSVWQIVNALRAGSDIAGALEAIVVSLTEEQKIAIRRYGQELNPYTMMYMLIAVIIPSLGITFIIILSSLAGMVIPKIIFPLIIMVLSFFQFFYMGLIKTKRPSMEI